MAWAPVALATPLPLTALRGTYLLHVLHLWLRKVPPHRWFPWRRWLPT